MSSNPDRMSHCLAALRELLAKSWCSEVWQYALHPQLPVSASGFVLHDVKLINQSKDSHCLRCVRVHVAIICCCYSGRLYAKLLIKCKSENVDLPRN